MEGSVAFSPVDITNNAEFFAIIPIYVLRYDINSRLIINVTCNYNFIFASNRDA